MAPRSDAFKQIRQRLRRSLRYGTLRMNCLTIQLSELVINYFDRRSNYDWLDVDFAARMSREGCLDPCVFVSAMIYIERLRRHNSVVFQRSNPNDLYLSALIVANKFMNDCGLDDFVWLDEWSSASSMNSERVRKLELKFLNDLSWDLMITPEQFDSAVRSLERGVAIKSAQLSGFLSYTDINSLVTDRRPFLSHVQRFLIMSLTVVSGYLALWAVSCGVFVGVSKMIEMAREDSTSITQTIDIHDVYSSPLTVHSDLAELPDSCAQFNDPIEMNATNLIFEKTFTHELFYKSLLTLRNHNGLFDRIEMKMFDEGAEICDPPKDFFSNQFKKVPIVVG
ncbi:Protein CNPPD1 [Aphelenchoides besseyi]|nr:Protein CNPPD1 [Aphelenchoides besseyi]